MEADKNWVTVTGFVARGHGVASGCAKDNPFGEGTIALQTPFFEKSGIPMSRYYPATINVDISPLEFDLTDWDYKALQVKWTPVIPPEDFYFSLCQIFFGGTIHAAMIYRPSPVTKVDHFQAPQIVEILSPKIGDLSYGDTVRLNLNADHCSIA